MFKKLINAQNEHMAKHQEKQDARIDKAQDKIAETFKHRVDELLFEGEEVINVYGLASDFAFITNERLVFVDGNVTIRKKAVVSIFYNRIQEVSFEYGHITGEVMVSTMNASYTLSLLSKDYAKKFAMEIMQQMRK